MDGVTESVASALGRCSDKKIAIGVSGGRDSMCLLHAVLSCGAVDKCNILAVHVNHGLRETAARDECFVSEYCKQNEVPFVSFSVDVHKRAAVDGLSIEQAARELRYGIFYDLIKRGDAAFVLTAHHALDNAESVLMHLFRGSGLDGLRKMNDSVILHPLIDVYPEELDEYAARHGIEYVTDETNFDSAPDRNFLRLKVLPLIAERYPGAVRAVNALSEECDNACKFLDDSLDESMISACGGVVTVSEKAMRSALADRYVRLALKHFSLTDVTRAQVINVLNITARRGGDCDLSNGVVATREGGGVSFYIPRQRCETVVPLSKGANFIDGLAIDVTQRAVDPKTVKGGAVDIRKLDGAELRFRRDGDTVTVFGGVKKKLRRFFIDSKIPERLRDRVPLICRGSEVLVVVGYQIAESVRQTDDTPDEFKFIVERRY